MRSLVQVHHHEKDVMIAATVFELVLDNKVEDDGPLQAALLWFAAQGLVEALNDIHDVGIIHRDLKLLSVVLIVTVPQPVFFCVRFFRPAAPGASPARPPPPPHPRVSIPNLIIGPLG